MLIVQRDKRFASWLYMQALLMLWPCLHNPFITLHNQHFIKNLSFYILTTFFYQDQKIRM